MPSTLSSKSPEAIAQELIQQAHHRDGIPEIVTGAFFLMTAGLICAQPYLPNDPAGRRATAIIIVLAVPLVLLLIKRIAVPWLRQRYFIESFGYVQYNQWTSSRLFAGLTFVAVLALLVFGVAPKLEDPHRWRPILTALLLAGVLMWWGRPRRIFWYGAIAAAVAAGLAITGTRDPESHLILFSVIGVCFLVGGALTFGRFLREHKARE